MGRKEKLKQVPKSARGLGYLSVIVLVTAALIIGATNEPIKDLLGTFTDTNAAPVASPSEPDAVLPPDEVSEIVKPLHSESVIILETDVTVLKVTVADSTRIEFVLEPASIGVDASHRRAILSITCALQKAGPVRRAVVFVGVGRYVDSAGRPALRSRAETKLSSLQLNRMNCTPEISERDIDWESRGGIRHQIRNPTRVQSRPLKGGFL